MSENKPIGVRAANVLDYSTQEMLNLYQPWSGEGLYPTLNWRYLIVHVSHSFFCRLKIVEKVQRA